MFLAIDVFYYPFDRMLLLRPSLITFGMTFLDDLAEQSSMELAATQSTALSHLRLRSSMYYPPLPAQLEYKDY